MIKLLIAISIVPASLITMIYGWGIEPENWGWIAAGYVWTFAVPAVSALISE